MATDVLDEVLKPNIEIEVKGKKLVIKPFKFKNISSVSKLMGGLFNSIEGKTTDAELISGVSDLISQDYDAISKIIADSTGLSKKTLEEMDMYEVIDIALAIFNLNKPFFLRALDKFHVPKPKGQ